MPNWLLFLPTGWLLAAIAVGGAVARLAVTLYPAASAREDKARLARDAQALLAPEIQANKRLVSEIQTNLSTDSRSVTIKVADTLNVAAWQTVSAGGLLVGLEPDQATKLLHVYNLVFQVNSLAARLPGIATAGNASFLNDQQRELIQAFVPELQTKLSELQSAFAEIDAANANAIANPNVARTAP